MKKGINLIWVTLVITLYAIIKIISIFITGMQFTVVVTFGTLALFLFAYCTAKKRTAKLNAI